MKNYLLNETETEGTPVEKGQKVILKKYVRGVQPVEDPDLLEIIEEIKTENTKPFKLPKKTQELIEITQSTGPKP